MVHICSRFDKKANELPILQNKLAQAKAQVDKLTGDLQKAHDDKERVAREKIVKRYIICASLFPKFLMIHHMSFNDHHESCNYSF